MIYTGTTISFMHNSKFQQVHLSHPKFQEIVTLCKDGDFGTAASLVDLKSVVSKALAGSAAELRDDNVYYKGKIVRSVLAQRIISMAREGFEAAPLLLFLENLMLNPSNRAVEELYGFLEASSLPITDDGCFLAYKSVRQDYMDHHSGTMDNSVGSVVSMERNKVDEDKDRTCSYGLHFAAHEYAAGFGSSGRMVVLKINPRDVVAIPSDYANQKGRCASYEVIEEVDRSDTKLVNVSFVDTGATKETPKVLSANTVEVGKSYMFSGRIFNEDLKQPFLATVISNDSKEVYIDPVDIKGNQVYSKNRKVVLVTVTEIEGTKAAYVPEEDNYDSLGRWSLGRWLGSIFIGDNDQFPVNRDVAYILTRDSDNKEYRGKFFFCEYDVKNDNLVFKRTESKKNGERYVTISDADDWEIILA
jgi:uncharacterized protein YpiB (UPF0302 family)